MNGVKSNEHIQLQEFTKRESATHSDNDQLAQLGKRAVLKRNFGYMSILGFSCTVLVTWEGTGALFLSGLQNGGPAGVIYGFLIVWLGNLSLFSTLSELVSMAPTSAGQYHWVSMLAPRSCAKFLSYITGWLTIGGWLGTVASAGYLTSSVMQAVIALTNPGYNPQPWQTLFIFWAVILFAVFINTVLSSLLPKFEGLILILHILGFFAILLVLVNLGGPKGDAEIIFTTFINAGGWPTMGLSFFVGLLGNAFAFVGADAAFHMAEEIQNPSVTIPRSLMLSLLINGATGFAMTIALLFCIGNPEDLEHSHTGFPFIDIYLRVTNSVTGSAVMTSIILTLAGCATVGVLASTSRLLWAFARDRGVPGWRKLSQIHTATSIPLYSIIVTTIIVSLLGIITIGSVIAFNNVISLSISGLYSSYFIASILLLYRRCTTGFCMPSLDSSHPALANTTGEALIWGPWHISGTWGIVNNTITCVYLIVIWFFSFWPATTPVTPETMNFSVVVTGAVFIFSVVYYLIRARKTYVGPVIEIN